MARYDDRVRSIHRKLSEVSPTLPAQLSSASPPPMSPVTGPSKKASAFPLHLLPEELLQTILSHLEKPDHLSLNLTSAWLRRKAAPHAWRHVLLTDCRAEHRGDIITRTSGAGTVRTSGIPASATVAGDEHDDTPALRKLWILATTPWLAREVVEVTYQCHLPPPAVFAELPRCGFGGQTLSCDPRTIKLVQLAVGNLTRVSTLRIVFGHARFTEALLRSFFAKRRFCENRVRRLWLECVRLNEALEVDACSQYGLPQYLDFTGLQTLRLRRLPLEVKHVSQRERMTDRGRIVYARGGRAVEMQNGLGGHYLTSVNTLGAEVVIAEEQVYKEIGLARYRNAGEAVLSDLGPDYNIQHPMPIETLFKAANNFDDAIYRELEQDRALPSQVSKAGIPSHLERSMLAYRDHWPDDKPDSYYPLEEAPDVCGQLFRRDIPTAATCALGMFKQTASTLTSLCLDWMLITPLRHTGLEQDYIEHHTWFSELFDLRFPHLRAFQYRNAVVEQTGLPPRLLLLDRSNDLVGLRPLSFMEAHRDLQCLAWPMDCFFGVKSEPEVARRAKVVVERLGGTLADLRVDVQYSGYGEWQSDDTAPRDVVRDDTIRRRRFITEFAALQTTVKTIKIEGGLPRDERREVIRALHRCPIEKIVLIGVCYPIGNTWGARGRDMAITDGQAQIEDRIFLEAEDTAAIHELGRRDLTPPPHGWTYSPSFAWHNEAPMLHTLASYHSATLRELKFCGYKGAPILLNPTPITTPFLHALKPCHKLEALITSFWLSTHFEGSPRDDQVISYWLDARSPSSTALVAPFWADPPEPGTWAYELKTKFAPDALAWRVTSFLGPFLSQEAKARKGGVKVRASFCVGDWGGIFDIDVRIGKGALSSDVCLGWEGPREEMEEGRRKGKSEGRGWF